MNNNSSFENRKFRDRMREMLTLFVFIILAAAASTVVMDVLIFPTALFAVTHRELYNVIIKIAFWAVLLGFSLFLIGRRVIGLRKDGWKYGEITRALLLKPLRVLSVIFVMLVLASAIVSLIYLLLSNNNYLLYKLINI